MEVLNGATLFRFSAIGDVGSSAPQVYGEGFVLTSEERDSLRTEDLRNDTRIFPLIGGEEINTSPIQGFARYVLNFGQLTLEEAANWPHLLAIVRERVKPERDKAKESTADGAHRKKYWWQFSQPRPELSEALMRTPRCLVNSRVSKHLAFCFQPTDRVFSHKLCVFPLDTGTAFAVLQSRIHAMWAWLLSSTMKTDLNYSASDCFETFPFPQPDPRAIVPVLENIGQRLHEARAAYMTASQQGLTQTYNRLKDPDYNEPEIVRLRDLHVELDSAALDAYGWADLISSPGVPPYTTPRTDAEKRAISVFEGPVIDRLFALNAERAAAERAIGADTQARSVKVSKPKKPTAKGKATKASQPRLNLESSDD